ncbi:venom serine protease-like [Oratosquilla oratoria]|uniref:venom serine protease-like n=1 Tax=Oratosquilla oratoria TaxID=337810 RepID=UPI003F76C7E6
MAALVEKGRNDLECGAVLVNPRFVLTSAHCVMNYIRNPLQVLLGEHDFATPFETTSTIRIDIDDYRIHPDFDLSAGFKNDIAALKLARSLNLESLSPDIGTVCLPPEIPADSITGTPVVAVGWGLQTSEGVGSTELMQVNLSLYSASDCRDSFPTFAIFIRNNNFCTWAPLRDTCKGDSGGPVMVRSPSGRLVMVGIVSFGPELCASDEPGVVVSVAAYLAWIRGEVGEASTCSIR